MTDPVLRWREDNPGYSGLQYAESRWPFVHEVPVLHLSWRVSMYNTSQLRILWEFASDGIELANYTASSEVSLDYEIENIKSDIVEKVWRSTGVASEFIGFDAGSEIGIDTFALINTNLSQNAVLTLTAYSIEDDYNNNTNAVMIDTIPMPSDPTEDNVIWIRGSAVGVGDVYQWYRLTIEDPGNADGYIEIGRCIGGQAFVFDTENCTTNIEFGYKNFKNEVSLNGYTAASNNRALKKTLRLVFQDLNAISRNNYSEWMRLVKYCRDTLKMLVIPDPQNPYRFSLFAKLTEIPMERTRYLDTATMYATIQASWDEGR